MARFRGRVGYGHDVDKGGGVHETEITEKIYSGDVTRNTRRNEYGDKVNDNLSVSNTISIVSDPYANQNFSAIRYVEWAGTLWKVSDVEVQSPRLLLRLGDLYNGPTASAPGGP